MNVIKLSFKSEYHNSLINSIISYTFFMEILIIVIALNNLCIICIVLYVLCIYFQYQLNY